MKVKNNDEKNSLVLNAVFNVVYRMLNILFPLITAGYVARVLTPAGVGLCNAWDSGLCDKRDSEDTG